MLTVKKENSGGSLTLLLSGSIEESVNFEQLVGPVSGPVRISSKDVPRINSVGVKAWIKYFQSLAAKGSALTFFDCSPAIVEQINLISNFTCGGAVESIYIPFACTSCKTELVGPYKCAELKAGGLQIPDTKCPKCGGRAVFDDIPEEFLGFLQR